MYQSSTNKLARVHSRKSYGRAIEKLIKLAQKGEKIFQILFNEGQVNLEGHSAYRWIALQNLSRPA
jgi:hypothetical protein